MDKLTKRNSNRNLIITYAIIFVLLFLLCLLFPYSGDDWAWGSQIGIDRLNKWFDIIILEHIYALLELILA